jgi:hypothetical protein
VNTAAQTPDRDAEMLAELAEMDLSAAKHVHAQLLAATDAGEVTHLGRAYQGASRALRQTLAQKAKMVRDTAELKARTMRPTNPGWAVDPSLHLRDWQIGERLSELQAAVDRVVHAEHPDNEDEREALSEFLDSTYDDWLRAPDFTTADLDTQVMNACRSVGLSQNLAARWRELPTPPGRIDDDDMDWPAETPEPLTADTS